MTEEKEPTTMNPIEAMDGLADIAMPEPPDSADALHELIGYVIGFAATVGLAGNEGAPGALTAAELHKNVFGTDSFKAGATAGMIASARIAQRVLRPDCWEPEERFYKDNSKSFFV